MSRFTRIELRTTDVDGARGFYARLLGDGPRDVVPLPAEATARGARPHWLGHLAVDDVERAATAFVAGGATRLGPTRQRADGSDVAILRDPGGAVVAVSTASAIAHDEVVWRVLSTTDLARVVAGYAQLFGWALDAPRDLGTLGVFRPFAWEPGGPSVGAFTDVNGRPGVHPHWLFHFVVGSLDAAIETVRSSGGLVLPPVVLPGGARIAVCDDPQGAAFALCETTPALG